MLVHSTIQRTLGNVESVISLGIVPGSSATQQHMTILGYQA